MTEETKEQPQPTTKAELLELMHTERAAFEETLARIPAAQMIVPIDGAWTVKDILAHIAAWEQMTLQMHMRGRSFEEVTRVSGVTYGNSSVDEINEAFYRRDRDTPLADVLASFHDSYADMVAELETIGEDRIFGPYTPPGHDSGGRLIAWIAGDTYEHYAEHRLTLEKLADAR